MEYFERMSVYYAASQAEALMCRGDPVVIVGGGNSAGQAAVFLSRHASRVTLVVRELDLCENMSRYLIDRVQRIANVDIMLGTEIRELLGDRALEAVTVEDRQSGARRTLKARALFVFIGVSPCTGWLGDLVDLDDHGFVADRPRRAVRSRDRLAALRPGDEPARHIRRRRRPERLGQTGRGGRRRGRHGHPAGAGTRPAGLGHGDVGCTRGEETAVPVMGFKKFERLFRAAAEVSVDRDDMQAYLDFVNDVIYDLLIIAQATAKANVRDVINPWDLPITKGLQESMHEFRRLDEEIELGPILESLAARPPLDVTLDDDTQARLPLLFGGISVALARTFKVIDAELKAVHTEEWERAFTVFRLLV